MSSTHFEASTQARVHDLAKDRATQLRQEALGDFWRGADAVWQRGVQSGQAALERSATRLQARLARHNRARNGRHSTATGV